MLQCSSVLYVTCKIVVKHRGYHQDLHLISELRTYYTWCQNESPSLTPRHSSSHPELKMRDQDAVSSLSRIKVSRIQAFPALLPSQSNMRTSWWSVVLTYAGEWETPVSDVEMFLWGALIRQERMKTELLIHSRHQRPDKKTKNEKQEHEAHQHTKPGASCNKIRLNMNWRHRY